MVKKIVDSPVSQFDIIFIDEAGFIPSQIIVEFENKHSCKIVIAEELNLDGSLPDPLEYSFCGEIYVFKNPIN